MKNGEISIPYDIYESGNEILIVMPLGGVTKKSLEIKIEDYKLLILGKREKKKLKKDFVAHKEDCYWGDIKTEIDLPPQSYFQKIHSILSPENILEIIIPKNNIPKKIDLKIE